MTAFETGQLLQRFACPSCSQVSVQPHGQPTPHCLCGTLMRWRRTFTFQPPNPRFGHAPALDFAPSRDRELPLEDAHGGTMRMESLHQLRKIERESERQFADGIGQPLRFRMYSQDASQRYENTFGPPPHQAPNAEWVAKQGPGLRSTLASPEDAGEMGPGAQEALASALPDPD